MPVPYHFYCEAFATRVYELDDGRFQLIDGGPVPPILSGYRYLLVENQLARYLVGLGVGRVRHEKAVLFNRASGEEFFTHTRLHVGQTFSQGEMQDLALDGPRLLTMNDETYFVSPELKLLLEQSPFKYLSFSEGFSEVSSLSCQTLERRTHV